MPIICVHALHSGSGSTTLTANIARTLRNLGCKVLMVSLSSKDDLLQYFSFKASSVYGCAVSDREFPDWTPYVYKVSPNLFLLPHGKATTSQQNEFKYNLYHNDDFIVSGLGTLLNHPELIIVFDIDSTYNYPFRALEKLADIHITPFLTEVSALKQLNIKNTHVSSEETDSLKQKQYFVFNKYNPQNEMSNNINIFMHSYLQGKLLGIIHNDSSVMESAKLRVAITDYNPASAAACDISEITIKLATIAKINFNSNVMNFSCYDSII